jgi:hypothetical protein
VVVSGCKSCLFGMFQILCKFVGARFEGDRLEGNVLVYWMVYAVIEEGLGPRRKDASTLGDSARCITCDPIDAHIILFSLQLLPPKLC